MCPDEEQPRETGPTSDGPRLEDTLAQLRHLVLEPHDARLRFLERRIEGVAGDLEGIHGNVDERVAGLTSALHAIREELGEVREEAGRFDLVEMGRLLPLAVAASQRDEGKLSHALSPIIEDGLERSVRKNPKVLADVIFPVLGPAIRKAIASALRSVMTSINRTVESAFTPRGLRWRMQAWRTNRSYAEVVLAHTLLYRVEGVYLIHRETGLLLQHVVPPAVEAQHPELVTSMMTAIEEFARDAFAAGEDGDLEQFRVGDLTVLVEHGPIAALALAVRGVQRPDLRTFMQETLEDLHGEHHEALSAFDGRSAVFEMVRPELEECLKSEVRERKRFPLGAVLAGTAALAVVALLATFWIRGRIRDRDWEAYLQRIDAQPGLVVVNAEERDGTYHVVGLRDPLAPDPWSLLADHGLCRDAVDGRWEAYRSEHPDFVLTRARRVLAPPAGIEFTLDEGVLAATGSAESAWTHDAARLALLIPGVDHWDGSALRDPGEWQLRLHVTAVERFRIVLERDADGREHITPNTLAEVGRRVRALDVPAASAGTQVEIRILVARGRGEARDGADPSLWRHAEHAREVLMEDAWKATTIVVTRDASPPFVPPSEDGGRADEPRSLGLAVHLHKP